MRIVFLGSGAFGLPTLQRLATRHDLVAVVSQPDRKAGRGGRLKPTPISQWTLDHKPDTPLLRPERINEPEIVERIRAYEADAWVVIAFGQKLGQALLDGVFAVNLHASLLPRWRGAAPINAAILAGDETTGNSVITLADKMDAGFVLGQSSRPIEPTMTAGDLHDLLAEDGPDLVESVLAGHAAGTLEPVEQDESRVTLASKLSKADGWVDFSSSADECRCRVHGLMPWPGVTVRLNDTPLKLLRVDVEHATSHQQGMGTIIDAGEGFVGCGDGSVLRLIEVQPAGKKPMPWPAFARGRHVEAGQRLVGKEADT
jgi:methionyl-tRNA formyltransferase